MEMQCIIHTFSHAATQLACWWKLGGFYLYNYASFVSKTWQSFQRSESIFQTLTEDVG